MFAPLIVSGYMVHKNAVTPTLDIYFLVDLKISSLPLKCAICISWHTSGGIQGCQINGLFNKIEVKLAVETKLITSAGFKA